MYSSYRLCVYNNMIQFNNLCEYIYMYISDDVPVWPKQVVEYTWKHGLS
jgi:hypothetical protein